MRIVYDDTMQNTFVGLVEDFLKQLDIKSVSQYEWGTNRIQMFQVKDKLNNFISDCYFEIGNKVTHAHGIGNNCNYPVYYYAENEIQNCAYINLNTGMYGEGYVSVEDYNGKLVSKAYELCKYGKIKVNGKFL